MLFKNHRNSYVKMSSSTSPRDMDQYSLLSPTDTHTGIDHIEPCHMVAEPSPISPTKGRRRSNTAEKLAEFGRRFSIRLHDSRNNEEKRTSMQYQAQPQVTSRERKRMSMPVQSQPQPQVTSREGKRMSMPLQSQPPPQETTRESKRMSVPVQPQPQQQTSRAAKRMSLPTQLKPQSTPRERKRMTMMSMSVPEESAATDWERKRMSLPVDMQSTQRPTREFRQRMATQYPIDEEAPVPRRRTTGERLHSLGKRMSLNDPQVMSQAMWGYAFY